MYLFHRAQITLLILNKAPIEVSKEYTKYANVFSKETTAELPEYIEINNYLIDLENSKQLSYTLIYSLESVELETLKIYIEDNL